MADAVKIGIIGGSGLYSMPGFELEEETFLETPFGKPSDAYMVGRLAGKRVAFLPRHGRGHRLSPSELNFRANIYGMKMLGVERIVSLSAVGSLKEEHRPLDFVLPDQFFDRTRGRISTFFGDGLVAHVSFADPICEDLAKFVQEACDRAGVRAKKGGTYLCMEGPAFSTKAEPADEATLKACATSGSGYYANASDADELSAIFDNFASKLTELRIAK